jgi:2-desacetyl-2-hydroxyethyl bacteriochlorophyllide A dehydrogenase
VTVEDVAYPVLESDADAVVRITTTSVCGTDLHIYRGHLQVEPGMTIGHEFVGEVVDAGDHVHRVAVGDRVLSCFQSACGTCFHCLRSEYQKCEQGRYFGLGAAAGGINGTQAEAVLVPNADFCLRRVPDGMADDVALFAGDVLSTGFHSVHEAGVDAGDAVAVMGLGAVGLCAVQSAFASGASRVFAIDSVEDRLALARSFGATPLHMGEVDVRKAIRDETGGRGVDLAVDAVGHPDVLENAIRMTRACGTVSLIGVYATRCEVHMGLAWYKSLRIVGGQANPIRHVDTVLRMLEAGHLAPASIVSHHMALEDAAEAYAIFDRREATKIVLTPDGPRSEERRRR